MLSFDHKEELWEFGSDKRIGMIVMNIYSVFTVGIFSSAAFA